MRGVCLALAIVVLLAGPVARAEPVTLHGITFSDELGGFVIRNGWGSGRLDDPFVIVEEVVDEGPAVLVIRGLTPAFGNPVRSNHFVGFALTKIVVNGTSETWQGFDLELQEELGEPSTYHDGLSFGQDDRADRLIVSDRFGWAAWTDEPKDGVAFADGGVAPGERVTISVIVTDNSPRATFYLVQHRLRLVAEAVR